MARTKQQIEKEARDKKIMEATMQRLRATDRIECLKYHMRYLKTQRQRENARTQIRTAQLKRAQATKDLEKLENSK